jgi:DNA-binding CsgD family transcriptional regulator
MRPATPSPATTALLADIFESLTIPVALLEGAFELRFINRAASALLTRSSCLRVADGRLAFAQDGVRARFRSLCDELLMEVAAVRRAASRALRVEAPDGADLDVLIHLRPQWLDGQTPAPLLVVIADLQQRASAVDLLRDLNGLTATESRVVQLLLHGERLAAIAENLRIGPETARSHMKRAFRKCGVHSQSQLVQLVARQLFTLLPFCADVPHPFGGDEAQYKVS